MIAEPSTGDGLFEGVVMIFKIEMSTHRHCHSDHFLFIGDDELSFGENVEMPQAMNCPDQFIVRQRGEYYFLKFLQLLRMDGLRSIYPKK
jgi:hypothetical protein